VPKHTSTHLFPAKFKLWSAEISRLSRSWELGTVLVYYGAADTCTAAVEFSREEILNRLTSRVRVTGS
jgi:Predicted glycosylase